MLQAVLKLCQRSESSGWDSSVACLLHHKAALGVARSQACRLQASLSLRASPVPRESPSHYLPDNVSLTITRLALVGLAPP